MLSQVSCEKIKNCGARRGTRTPILLRGLAPKASASTNFAILALFYAGRVGRSFSVGPSLLNFNLAMPAEALAKAGGLPGNRTPNLQIKSLSLYQLS